MISLLTSEDVETKRGSIGALSSLACNNYTNKDAIREAQGIPAVISLLTSADVEIQKDAIITINNLLYENNKNKLYLCENHDIAILIPFLSSFNSEIQLYLVSILLLLGRYNKNLLSSLDLMESLTPLLNSSHEKTKAYADELTTILQEINAPRLG